MKKIIFARTFLFAVVLSSCTILVAQTDNVVDEVIWVVGDEPILRSDVEAMRLQAQSEGVKWGGDPDCAIPERLAVDKLFLHQAAIDSLEVTESEISTGVEQQISYWIELIGSKEKLEEYKKESISQLRSELHDDYRDRQLVQKMKEKIVKDMTVTPSEVRRYFHDVPVDSIPYVPTEVEVEIITQTPRIEQDEINRVKDELRDYTDRINKGESQFSTLATLYSEDPGSARKGGELGYMGRGMLDPAFANVAFNLTDPKKVSKIVESEFGYHIIQLIDKRGDKVNVRHILRKPHVSDEAINKAILRLDSIANDIRAGKFTFEDGATYASDDKETRSNHGLMANSSQTSRTSKFRLQDLPASIARVVDSMKVGQVSRAFQMINEKGKTVCVIAKLKSRIDGHKATMADDFQTLKDVVLNKHKEDKIHQWVVDKLKTTYVRVNDRYKNCTFEYQGWIK
jgi:peptidyl-prolyl cis-trans isomerase SurA